MTILNQNNMKREEAIELMKEGVKITHNWFTSDEWITIDKGKILLSCGTVCDYYEFFNARFQNGWKYGYEIFKETEK